MDTLKDKQWLESLYESGSAPWQVLGSRPRRGPSCALRRLRLMLPLTLGQPEARRRACSRSAPTPTTSRSAAAARS